MDIVQLIVVALVFLLAADFMAFIRIGRLERELEDLRKSEAK